MAKRTRSLTFLPLPFLQCFLSIPGWIYLIMTPRFERTRRFANPYVMLGVDGLFIVLWLSAFSTQAAYNSSGQCGGSCGISKAIVAVGVFVTYVYIHPYVNYLRHQANPCFL